MSALVKSADYTREQVETIKATVARGATDSQLALFLQTCKSRGLDPFTKQVYFTPQGIIVSIDGLRSIAERTGAYAPGPTRFEYDDKGNLVAAHVTVRKLVAGTWFDLEESAYLEEYMGSSPIWKAKKRVMLSKCAESRALRRCFSSELSGLYESSELDQARDEVQVGHGSTVEVAPVNRDEAFEVVSGALTAIAQATTLDQLKAIAGSVTAGRVRLTEEQRSELRAAYVARKVELEAQ
jgi:phage recombination protein Bet